MEERRGRGGTKSPVGANGDCGTSMGGGEKSRGQ